MWMQVWNTYLTVILTHNPARALELVGYQQITTSASQTLPLQVWLKYDGQFCTIVASNPYLQWDQCLPDMWHKTVTSATNAQGWPCTYCGAKTHFPDNCPRLPFRNGSQSTRPPNLRESRPPNSAQEMHALFSTSACLARAPIHMTPMQIGDQLSLNSRLSLAKRTQCALRAL